MELLPTEAPVYGGGLIVAFLPEDYILPEHIRAFLVFKGSQQRQVTEAKISMEDNAFHAVVPDHEPPEQVEVSVYIQFNNLEGKSIGNEPFTYYLDQTCYLARYLADSVHKLYALEDWDYIQGPNFSLEQEDFNTLDERLTSAFQHLILPPHWNLLGDPDIEKIPRETLFHFASRLGLSTFVTLLLEKNSADECLNLRNRHGELAKDIARERNFDGLADLITDPHAHGVIRWESKERIGENTVLKRQSFGTISTISELVNGNWPPLEEEIAALSKTIPPSTPIPHQPNMWNNTIEGSMYFDESYEGYISPFDYPHTEYKRHRGGMDGSGLDTSGEVLSDNLKHLQEISDGIHYLRHKDLERLRENESQEARLSSSCPALNQDQSTISSTGEQDDVYETPDTPIMARTRRALPLNLSDEQLEEQIQHTNLEEGDSPDSLQRRHSWHSSESIDDVSPSQKRRFSFQQNEGNEENPTNTDTMTSPTLRRVERNNMATFSIVVPTSTQASNADELIEIDGPLQTNQRSKSLSMNNNNSSDSIDIIERRKTISEGLTQNDIDSKNHLLAIQHFVKNTDDNPDPVILSTSSPKELSLSEFLSDPTNFGGSEDLKIPPPVPPKPEMGAAARRIVTRKLSFLGKMRSSARSKPKDKKKSFSELKFGNGPRLDEEGDDSLDGAIPDPNTLKKTKRPSIIQQRPQSMMINRPATYDIGNPAYHRDAPISGTTGRNPRPLSNYSNTSLKSLGDNLHHKSSNRSSYHEDEDKEYSHNIYNNLKDSGSIESLDEATAYDTTDIESDLDLMLRTDEANWSGPMDKKVLKKMQKKDIKRQENIFEFIQTERNYLTILKIMQKIFARGMSRKLHVDQQTVDKLFPLIDEHVEYVAQFVAALNDRQAEEKVVHRIGDLLVKQWSGESGNQMKRLFGDFCCKQNEITSFYKDLHKNDKKFQAFIRECEKNPLVRRMSVPSCALFITQRITKYPIMLQTLCENTVKKDHKEDSEDLDQSLELSRQIAKDVDDQVQAHERELLLIEIYEKTESRTTTSYKDNRKFDRKDLLAKKRKLLYSLDSIQWKIKDAKKFTDIYFLLLSDCIVLLQENNGKYAFPSGQPAAIPLSKLIVREVASDEKSLFLMSISTQQMYTLKVTSSEERKNLPQKIQMASNNCPDEDEGISEDEEERRIQDEKCEKTRGMIDQLEHKDSLINKLLSEKMLLFRSLAESVDKGNAIANMYYTYPNYHSMESENGNNSKIPACTPSLLKAIEQVEKLSIALYGTDGPPSITSLQEQRSTPQLPKRSDTFGGFDNGKENPTSSRNTWHSSQSDSKLAQLDNSIMTSSSSVNRDSGLIDSEVMGQRTDSQSSIPQAWAPNSESSLSITPSGTFMPPNSEQVVALTQVAHLLNLHLSVAAQQDTRTEKLQQQLRESQDKTQHRRKLGGSLQEAELKRNQIKQQEQLNDLRRQQQALRNERGQWERQYERFQKSMEEDRREVEEEKKKLLQQKEENERQRDENLKNKEDYQREMSRLRELQRKHQEQPQQQGLNRNNSSNQVGENNLSKSHLSLQTGGLDSGKAPPSPTYMTAAEYPRTFPGPKSNSAVQAPVNQVPFHLQYSATNQLARTQGPKHQEIPSKLSNLSTKHHGKNSKVSKPQSSINSLRGRNSLIGMFRNNSQINLQVPPTQSYSTNQVVPRHLSDSSNSSNERKSPNNLLKENKTKNDTVELFL